MTTSCTAGSAATTITGSGGNDTAYRQDEDSVAGVRQDVKVEVTDAAKFIEIKGSPEFQERVRADLDMMNASPIGQKMLAEQERIHNDSAAIAADWPVLGGVSYQGNPLVIEEAGSNTASYSTNWHLGEDYKITYNPSRLDSSDQRPPIAGLFHEMAHVYDYGNNTSAEGNVVGGVDDGIENDEREAVGLPIDHDQDPSTPDRIDPDHPYDYTENRFRDEMGWPTRKSYSDLKSAWPRWRPWSCSRLVRRRLTWTSNRSGRPRDQARRRPTARSPSRATGSRSATRCETRAAEAVVAYIGVPGNAASHSYDVFVTAREDGTVEIAKRTFAIPPGTNADAIGTIEGVVIPPGEQFAEDFRISLPLKGNRPYVGEVKLPDPVKTVVFCIGAVLQKEAPAPKPADRGRGAYPLNGPQHLFCSEPASLQSPGGKSS